MRTHNAETSCSSAHVGKLRILCFAILATLASSAGPHGAKYGGFVGRDGKLVYTQKKVETPRELWAGQYRVPDRFDSPEVLRHLYGEHFDPNDHSGKGGLFVFGNHNTGTSMLTRLVMLMGAFQGNLEGLSTSQTNRLKYWEKLAVSHFHDMLLQKYSDPHFKPYHAQGLDLSTLTAEDRWRLEKIAEGVLQDQDRHQPWVLKDPRMLFFAEAWISKARNPVCLITYKEPIGNAISLTGNKKKSVHKSGVDGTAGDMTVERWLDAWEQGILSVLFACMGYPSVLIEAESLKGNIQDVAVRLMKMIERTGVTGLKLPRPEQLQAEFGAFIKPSRGRDANITAFSMTPTQEALDFAFRKVLELSQDEASFQPTQTVSVLLDIWKSHLQSVYGVQKRDVL